MKKKTKIGAVLCCSTALVSILGGYLLTKNLGLFNWGGQVINQNENQSSELETTQTTEHMSVMLMNKVSNQDGTVSYTYTFAVSPDSSTRKDISGTLAFSDDFEGIDDYLSFSIDNLNSTFTVTKKADFSHQAILSLSCNADPSVKATITFDCKQYFKGFNDVTEKTYRQLLTENNSLLFNGIKNDGALTINASNFSTVYTIPTNTNYRVEEITVTNLKYITGDDIENMSDSGLTIDNNYAISQVNLKGNVTLQSLHDAVYSDTALMPGTNALTYSSKELFGIGYDLQLTYNVASVIKSFTAHMVVVANTSDLDFGLPTGLSVESNHVTFEEVVTTVRFVYTDANDNVSYINTQSAGGTGWLSTGNRVFNDGYINVEVTRTLDGNVISGPTIIYNLNNGKGYYTGNESSKFYIVYNPGGYEAIRWSSIKTMYNTNLYAISNYASSSY